MSSNKLTDRQNYIASGIGQRLKALRGDRTQKDVAKALEMNPAQYNRYEKGRSLPDSGTLERLASFYGCSLKELASEAFLLQAVPLKDDDEVPSVYRMVDGLTKTLGASSETILDLRSQIAEKDAEIDRLNRELDQCRPQAVDLKKVDAALAALERAADQAEPGKAKILRKAAGQLREGLGLGQAKKK